MTDDDDDNDDVLRYDDFTKQPIKPNREIIIKTTYQIPPGPIHVPRIARFRAPPLRPVRVRVQNLCNRVHSSSITEGILLLRTRIKSVLSRHARVFLE
jgi:hypothetical protein